MIKINKNIVQIFMQLILFGIVDKYYYCAMKVIGQETKYEYEHFYKIAFVNNKTESQNYLTLTISLL